MNRPTITRAQYDAIMALRPETVEERNALVDRFRQKMHTRGGDMGFLQELDRVLTKAQHSKFLAPDSYSLEKAPARSLDDLHNISTLLVVLIADKRAQLPENEKNKLLDDLNRYMLEAIREFNPVSVSIPLFRIID